MTRVAKVIKSDKMLHLSDKQHLAIKEMMQGKRDYEVARAVGVSRKTINQWKNDNPFFLAELNAKRKQAWEAFLDEYRDLLGTCFQTIKTAIDEGDVKTAIWFMEKTGVDEVVKKHIGIEAKIGPDDPQEILENRAYMQAREQVLYKINKKKSDPFSLYFKPLPEDVEREVVQVAKTILSKLKEEAVAKQLKNPDEVA